MSNLSDETQQSHAQQFEQALATLFTCRSILKYNPALSEEQRNELIADIDTTLRFLRDRLIANASIEAKTVLPQLQQAGIISIDHLEDKDEDEDVAKGKDEGKDIQTLRELHRIYYTYLSTKQVKGADEFAVHFNAARFNEIMSTINEVQKIMEKSRDVYPSHVYVEDLLHSVRGFIVDLYYTFMKFAQAITNVLQASDIPIDTEEVTSISDQLPEEGKQDTRDITPLVKVYEAHQRLNERKGAVLDRVSDATLFLVVLEEHLGSDFDKRDEVIAHLVKVAKLLHDLSYLLSDYEGAVVALLD